ncbi:MAG: WD40 repeat domain-containing protein [Candidatus Methylacidiphilales bacterium]
MATASDDTDPAMQSRPATDLASTQQSSPPAEGSQNWRTRLAGWVRAYPLRSLASAAVLFLVLGILGIWAHYHFLSTSIFRMSAVLSMSWSADGKQVAVAYEDGGIIVATFHDGAFAFPARSVRTVLPATQKFMGPEVDIQGDFLAWSPDGRYLAAEYGETVKVWHLPNMQEIINLERPSVSDQYSRLTWSSDNRLLAIAGEHNIEICDVTLGGRAGSLKPFWPLGVSVSADELLVEPSQRTNFWQRGIWWSPDGAMLATVAPDDFRIYEAATGEQIMHQRGINFGPCRWSPDSNQIAVMHLPAKRGDKRRVANRVRIQVWDVSAARHADAEQRFKNWVSDKQSKPLRTLQQKRIGPGLGFSNMFNWSRDGRLIGAMASHMDLIWWNTTKGNRLAPTLSIAAQKRRGWTLPYIIPEVFIGTPQVETVYPAPGMEKLAVPYHLVPLRCNFTNYGELTMISILPAQPPANIEPEPETEAEAETGTESPSS